MTTVYLDSVSPEEKNVFDWLKIHHPDLELCATIQAKMRVLPRHTEEKVLAWQKAAWFSGSSYLLIWCRVVVYGALMGFEGLWN